MYVPKELGIYSLDEAAELLRCHPNTVRKLLSSELLHRALPIRTIWILEQELRDLVGGNWRQRKPGGGRKRKRNG